MVELDTSGFVEGRPEGVRTKRFWWKDLAPFTQGYVGALLRDFKAERDEMGRYRTDWPDYARFHHLAPATLQRITEDCARFKSEYGDAHENDALDGQMFWLTRRDREWADVGFPPLALLLADDGLIYAREIAVRQAIAQAKASSHATEG